MPVVTAYDSVDDMMGDLRSSIKAADSRVKEWQKKVKKGDKYLQATGYGFDIYGEVIKKAGGNYRLVFAFSEACPEGELGETHVSSMTRLMGEEEYNKCLEHHGAKPYRDRWVKK